MWKNSCRQLRQPMGMQTLESSSIPLGRCRPAVLSSPGSNRGRHRTVAGRLSGSSMLRIVADTLPSRIDATA
jgi:hypothetical protein